MHIAYMHIITAICSFCSHFLYYSSWMYVIYFILTLSITTRHSHNCHLRTSHIQRLREHHTIESIQYFRCNVFCNRKMWEITWWCFQCVCPCPCITFISNANECGKIILHISDSFGLFFLLVILRCMHTTCSACACVCARCNTPGVGLGAFCGHATLLPVIYFRQSCVRVIRVRTQLITMHVL